MQLGGAQVCLSPRLVSKVSLFWRPGIGETMTSAGLGFGCHWLVYYQPTPANRSGSTRPGWCKYSIISDISHVLNAARIAFLAELRGIDKPNGIAILEASKAIGTSPLGGESPSSLTRKGNSLSPRAL